MNSQGKFLLGLAAGGIAVGSGFVIYSQAKVSAGSKTGLTPLTKNTIDARYVTCNAANSKNDSKGLKGDDGLYYQGDKKAVLSSVDIKDDAKYIKTDGKIFKTDSVKYDAKPTVTGDAKVYKNDDGKYLKSDGKSVATVAVDSKSLIKVDGKIYSKGDKSLSSTGPVYVVDGAELVCTTDGRALALSSDTKVTVLDLTPQT